MNTSELIAAIDAEISRLQQARKLLSGSTATRGSKRGAISAEGRARISAAMKKRWAQQKRAAKERRS
jgi:hypothetical protein